RLRRPSQDPAADPTRADRRCLARRVRRGGRGRAETCRQSSDPGRARRAGDRMVGQGRRPGLAPLGVQGGRRPPRQGDRIGRQARCDGAERRAAPRIDRLRLQTSYGQALFWAEGFGAPATSAAFARARELAGRVEDPSERFSAYWGLSNGHFMRGEPAPMREVAELFLCETTARRDCPEAVIAHRMFGSTRFYFG